MYPTFQSLTVSAVIGLTLVAGCGLGLQTLTSPCLGQAATDGGLCPGCQASSDCVIVGNECYASAGCVPKAGNWATTAIGCASHYDPPTDPCVCLENVCQAQLSK